MSKSRFTAATFADVERNAKKLLASRKIADLDKDLPEWFYQAGAHAAIFMSLIGVAGLLWPEAMADFRYWLSLNGLWPF